MHPVSTSLALSGGAFAGLFSGFFLVVDIVLVLIVLAGMWKMFEKAGRPGWACIIPIYNWIVVLEIAGKPIWWIVLLFIPIVNLIVSILVFVSLAERFGKGGAFAAGLFFLGFIFFPILGFGEARYQAA